MAHLDGASIASLWERAGRGLSRRICALADVFALASASQRYLSLRPDAGIAEEGQPLLHFAAWAL